MREQWQTRDEGGNNHANGRGPHLLRAGAGTLPIWGVGHQPISRGLSPAATQDPPSTPSQTATAAPSPPTQGIGVGRVPAWAGPGAARLRSGRLAVLAARRRQDPGDQQRKRDDGNQRLALATTASVAGAAATALAVVPVTPAPVTVVVMVAPAMPMAVSATAAATPAVAMRVTVCVPLVMTALGLVVIAGFACCGGVGLGNC